MLLPTHNTALRRDLEKWFRSVAIEPVVVGEFEDAALAKIIATELGIGITAVPTIVAAEAIERYGFVSVGQTEECQIQFYLNPLGGARHRTSCRGPAGRRGRQGLDRSATKSETERTGQRAVTDSGWNDQGPYQAVTII